MLGDAPTSAGLVWRVARGAFARQSTYRTAAVGGAAANTAVALLKASVLLAVVSQRGEIRGFDAADLVTFSFLSMALDAPVAMFEPLDLARRVRTGDVVIDLYRPADIQLYWLAEAAGKAGFNVAARLAPPILVGGLIFHLRVPADAQTWGFFALSLAAAIVLSFALRFVLALTAFFTLEVNAIPGITNFLIVVLSGWMLPLALFPPVVESVARQLPFAAVAQLPIEVFLGKHDGTSFAAVLGRQLLWAAAFLVGGRVLLGRATRRVVVQGG